MVRFECKIFLSFVFVLVSEFLFSKASSNFALIAIGINWKMSFEVKVKKTLECRNNKNPPLFLSNTPLISL